MALRYKAQRNGHSRPFLWAVLIVLLLRWAFGPSRFGGQPFGLDPLTTDGPSAHPRAWPMGLRPIGHAGIMGLRPIIPLLSTAVAYGHCLMFSGFYFIGL